MPWVEFTDKFDFTPGADRRTTTAYKAGHRVLVTTECFEKASAKGVAFKIKPPARGELPTGEPIDPAPSQDPLVVEVAAEPPGPTQEGDRP